MVLAGVLTTIALQSHRSQSKKKLETSTLLQIFISHSVLECPNGINCLEKAFYQILAARYRSNPTEGTERSRNEGGECDHKQQQHAIYGGRDGGEADTKYKVGGHVRSAGGNYHSSVNVISQARNKPHQFRMVLHNTARCCSIPNNIVQFHRVWSMKQ